MEQKEISQAVIGRLPRYFRYLGELKDEGTERVSSQELSDIMGSRDMATMSDICTKRSERSSDLTRSTI